MRKDKTAYAFIDASNLFYGGEKSLGWKIDYQKLLGYLGNKYNVSTAFYFGGVETHGFHYNVLREETVPLGELASYLNEPVRQMNYPVKHDRRRVRFYQKLKSFGYQLYLKPVKSYQQDDGTVKRKANCDVEMAFYLMKEISHYDRVLILSGDGDFLPVLRYLKEQGKEVVVLARGERTAKEIRQFAGGNFRDFVRLEKYLKFEIK